MKKLIIIMAAAMMAVGSSAQVVTSRTKIRAKSQTTWFARLGMSINNVTNGQDRIDYDASEYKNGKGSIGSKVGMDLTVGFMKNIGKSGLYWGMDLGIGTRGGSCKIDFQSIRYDYENDTKREYVTDYSYKGSALTWNFKYSPFTIGYKYSVTDDLKLDGHLGAYISYDFAGGTKWVEEDETEKHSFSDMKDEDWDYQPLDAGMQIGIGAWWKKFNFDITYQRGFIPAANVYNGDGYSDICSSNLMLRVGYAF